MSKVNIVRNTFLEAEELTIFQQMLEDSVAKAVTLSNTITWGIIRDYTEAEDTSFKVGTGTNVGTVKIGKTVSRAVGSDGLLCTQLAINNIAVPQDGNWYWMRISHKYRRNEKGDVSIALDGTLSGSSTEFTKVLRGVQSDVPTKVRFIKTDGSQLLNSGIYEVVEVKGDLVAILNSPLSFLEETNLRMVVVGATPINETITPAQLEGLYFYDDCNIEFVQEVTTDTDPTSGVIQNRTFYIARVQNNAGIVAIQDKRTQYWQPNVPGVTDRLSKFENLNDLNNKATARANLDVYSKGESDARYLLGGDSSAFLLKTSNLSDVPDKTAARSNLSVYSVSQVEALLDAIRQDISAVYSNITLAANVSLTVGTDTGWAYLVTEGTRMTLHFKLSVTPGASYLGVFDSTIDFNSRVPFTRAGVLISTFMAWDTLNNVPVPFSVNATINSFYLHSQATRNMDLEGTAFWYYV